MLVLQNFMRSAGEKILLLFKTVSETKTTRLSKVAPSSSSKLYRHVFEYNLYNMFGDNVGHTL